MSYQHCIITRFSYRFRQNDPILPLLSPERLTERIRIFGEYCFPSITNQIEKNFSWIIIIDPLLPDEIKLKLEKLILDFKQSALYQTRGPRNIWLHIWDWDTQNLGKIDWILPYFQAINYDSQSVDNAIIYLITTRLDDDDSLHEKFTQLIKSQLYNRKRPIKDFRYISFCNGYYYYSNPSALKRSRIPMIALGLTLITKIERYPLCVYMGNHTKIPIYVKKPETHKLMHSYAKKNKDMNITKQKIMERILVIRGGDAMYLRHVHDFNLQKNILKRRTNKKQDQAKIRDILYHKFHHEQII